jgi:hypothetical protein
MDSIRLFTDPIQSLAAGSISAAYMGIGAEFDKSARMIAISNLTDNTLMFSWDGVNDHFPLLRHTYLVLTVTQNNEDEAEYFALPAGSRLYVKRILIPTEGAVYITHFRGITDA